MSEYLTKVEDAIFAVEELQEHPLYTHVSPEEKANLTSAIKKLEQFEHHLETVRYASDPSLAS